MVSGVTRVATSGEQPPTKPVSQFSKAAALAVVETQALASQSGLQPSILFAEARQFLALRRRQAGPSMRAIGVRTPDPDAEIGLGEIGDRGPRSECSCPRRAPNARPGS